MTQEHVLVLVGLAAFAFLYNLLVAWMDKEFPNHGLVAEQVIGGVVVVLISLIPVLGLEATLIVFAHFAVAGFFMWAGQKIRYYREQRRIAQVISDISKGFLERGYDETQSPR